MLPILSTPDLVLRPFTIADAPALFAYASDPHVTQFTAWKQHTTLDESRHFILQSQKTFLWAITHRTTGIVLGECGLRPTSLQSTEIHCALAPLYWGKGYGYQALNALLHYAFYKHDVNEVHASCITMNHRSHALLGKLGMRHVVTQPQGWYNKGKLHDVAFYVITREQFCTHREKSLPSIQLGKDSLYF